jgi:hypothetical protein
MNKENNNDAIEFLEAHVPKGYCLKKASELKVGDRLTWGDNIVKILEITESENNRTVKIRDSISKTPAWIDYSKEIYLYVPAK